MAAKVTPASHAHHVAHVAHVKHVHHVQHLKDIPHRGAGTGHVASAPHQAAAPASAHQAHVAHVAHTASLNNAGVLGGNKTGKPAAKKGTISKSMKSSIQR